MSYGPMGQYGDMGARFNPYAAPPPGISPPPPPAATPFGLVPPPATASQAGYPAAYMGGSAPSGQSGEVCQFFVKSGWCKFGESCRHMHVPGPDTPLNAGPGGFKSGEACQFFAKAGWCKFGDQCRHEHIAGPDTPTPPPGGGPPGAGDPCKFFQKAGWCQFGDGCRYQHIPGPETPVGGGDGKGGAVGSSSGPVGGGGCGGGAPPPCQFFQRSGWCKYESACRYSHVGGPGAGGPPAPPPVQPQSSMSAQELESQATALIATAGMKKAESIGLMLTDEAVKALLTLPTAHASELLDSVADKHATLRDHSAYVCSTIARGYVPKMAY